VLAIGAMVLSAAAAQMRRTLNVRRGVEH
jgi:hypothetical protein